MRRMLLLAILAAVPLHPPATPKNPVTEVYHGVSVTDPYRWLENGSDPAAQEWVAAQNQYSRAVLDSMPDRTAIEARLRDLLTDRPASYFALQSVGGRLFA